LEWAQKLAYNCSNSDSRDAGAEDEVALSLADLVCENEVRGGSVKGYKERMLFPSRE